MMVQTLHVKHILHQMLVLMNGFEQLVLSLERLNLALVGSCFRKLPASSQAVSLILC